MDAAPAPREDTASTVLTEAGFEFIGEWTQDPESLLRLDAKAPSLPGVYAFIVDDIVVYVGLTLSGLKTRFDQYRRGHKGQRTSSRINGTYLPRRCRAGKKVKVLVATPEPSRVAGTTGEYTAAGLEVGLIEMIRPSWNTVATQRPHQDPAAHPSVQRASIINSIGEALAGGPRYTTAIDPSTGVVTRTKVPLSRSDIGMAIAMETLSGALSGLSVPNGPGNLGRAAGAGYAQAVPNSGHNRIRHRSNRLNRTPKTAPTR